MVSQMKLVERAPIQQAEATPFEGRLLVTVREIEELKLVPLHRETIGKLIAPGGEWDRYGMVRRFSGDGPRNVLISLPMLVEWSMGGPGHSVERQRQEAVIASQRMTIGDLRRRLKFAEDAVQNLLSIVRGGSAEDEGRSNGGVR